MNKIICLVDGEHYLPVTKSAVLNINDSNHNEVQAIIFIGGTEKLKTENHEEYSKLMGFPVYFGDDYGEIPYDLIEEVIDKYGPDCVMDLSDKIIGTGKRIGKTAVSTYTSRLIEKNKYNPCVVAMGRGGPEKPELVRGDLMEITPEFLMEQSEKGVHAASDHWEDALMSRVLTIGCRRCGGGLSGEVFMTNMKEGAKIANEQDKDLIIFEGSGAAIPPIKTDKNILLIGANQNLLNIVNFFGPFRIGLSDLVILTMCEEPMVNKEKVQEIIEFISSLKPEIKVIPTVFRPKPLKNIEGKNVLFATTAPEAVKDKLVKYLEKEYKCNIVGTTSHLSNRPLLREDIKKYMADADCMLTELKAAAVDVATKEAIESGLEVVYSDNIPIVIDDDSPDIDSTILELVDSAIEDFNK